METKVSYKGNKAFSLLGIVFIVLKLIGVIDWSWWWVLLPLWGPFVLFITVFIIIGLIVYINVK